MQDMQETQVWSLGQEDPLEEETAAHSSILAPKIPQTEEPGYNLWGCKELDTTKHIHMRAQHSEKLLPQVEQLFIHHNINCLTIRKVCLKYATS